MITGCCGKKPQGPQLYEVSDMATIDMSLKKIKWPMLPEGRGTKRSQNKGPWE